MAVPTLPLTKTIVGYSDHISVEAGDMISFMISCYDDQPSFRADIVRLVCGDDDPNGPGVQEHLIETSLSGHRWPARRQDINAGSCVLVPDHLRLQALTSFSLQAFIWPTTVRRGLQGIVTRWDRTSRTGFGLVINEQGALALMIGNGRAFETVTLGHALKDRTWYLVAGGYDAETERVSLDCTPVEEATTPCPVWHTTTNVDEAPQITSGDLLIGAGRCESGQIGFHFNGKIERPRILRRIMSIEEQKATALNDFPREIASELVAAWDFSQGIPTTGVIDLSPNGLHGCTINLPGRAVTGVTWTGEFRDWQQCPQQYGAIHFHEDDLADAAWTPDFQLRVPEDWKSGVYAARVRTESGEDYIPFFVRHGSRTKVERAKICLLLSTATYMAYANNHTIFDDPFRELEKGTLLEVRAEDLFLHEHREFGLSTYDTHIDGSGVFYSTRLRPILNMRPKHTLWNFNAATHITDWLEKLGYDYDVLTDEDVHYRGYEALSPYPVLITDTHPEYVSREMLDALKEFQSYGGRMMYLGGNGYYWRISFLTGNPGVIELRRAENGTRGWAAEPGEYYHSTTGEYGGLWRLIGRPPQQLVGVGYAAAGFDVSSYYRRRPDSYDSRAAFIFDGVDEDIIGDFGLLGGGAAGWELDRFDTKLGSPGHALLLASSENHSNVYMAAIEETHAPHIALNGIENPKVCADLVFYECGNGGAIFSTGSIAWAASLSANQYTNNVSRITSNVLTRFLDPSPF